MKTIFNYHFLNWICSLQQLWHSWQLLSDVFLWDTVDILLCYPLVKFLAIIIYGIAQYIRTTLVCLIWHFQATKTGGIVQKKLLWWFVWNELYAFCRLVYRNMVQFWMRQTREVDRLTISLQVTKLHLRSCIEIRKFVSVLPCCTFTLLHILTSRPFLPLIFSVPLLQVIIESVHSLVHICVKPFI